MPSYKSNHEDGGFEVKISADALIRMITHVLRFGNDALDESVEVMGICIGKADETNNLVNLINVIPIQHGIHVSTGFTKEDIDLFAKLDKEYQTKDMNVVGWYISRPGWGLDFTEITIQNHKFFQTDKNPQGFIIIFDHTLMVKKKRELNGFKIYSLKEYKKSNEYYEVSYDLEIPANLNFFKWVQKFVEDSQSLSPVIIKEIKEPGLSELQEIPLTAEDLIEKRVKDYSGQVDQIISGFNNGLVKLNQAIDITYKTQFNTWIGEVTQGSLKGMDYIGRSLNQLKNTISDGLRDMKRYFNSTFEEISGFFKKNITEYIDRRVNSQQELKKNIEIILNATVEESKIKIKDQIENIIRPWEEKVHTLTDILEKTSNLNSQTSTLVMELNNITSDKNNEIKNFMTSINEKLEKVTVPLKTQIDAKFEDVETELKPIKDSYSEIKILLEKLQKTITEFRNLT
ncbi:MAG: hypothetical protein ACFFA0_03185 [Promethearchaeota archaeon]